MDINSEKVFPAQVVAGRGLLGWTQAELSERALVSISTVKKFESGGQITKANRAALIGAFDTFLVFVPGGVVRERNWLEFTEYLGTITVDKDRE
jgi:transcriptional regulator with XRE-family HTH domain